MAQESNPINQAEATYRTNFDLYRQQYQAYQIAKSEWGRSNSLKSEQEALVAGRKVAHTRNEVQKSYLLWLGLKLRSFSSVYSEATGVIDGIFKTNIDWLSTHQSKITSVSSITEFDEAMTEYVEKSSSRNKAFTQGQIHLKLAQLTSYQHQIRSLYDPILSSLQNNQEAEVKQGLLRISSLGEEVNKEILNSKNVIGSLESNDFSISQASQKASESFEVITSKQLELLDLMNELKQRYVLTK